MNWTEEYWPLVIELYMEKPVGIKAMYSRKTVALALELHIHPSMSPAPQAPPIAPPPPSRP